MWGALVVCWAPLVKDTDKASETRLPIPIPSGRSRCWGVPDTSLTLASLSLMTGGEQAADGAPLNAAEPGWVSGMLSFFQCSYFYDDHLSVAGKTCFPVVTKRGGFFLT